MNFIIENDSRKQSFVFDSFHLANLLIWQLKSGLKRLFKAFPFLDYPMGNPVLNLSNVPRIPRNSRDILKTEVMSSFNLVCSLYVNAQFSSFPPQRELFLLRKFNFFLIGQTFIFHNFTSLFFSSFCHSQNLLFSWETLAFQFISGKNMKNFSVCDILPNLVSGSSLLFRAHCKNISHSFDEGVRGWNFSE